MSETAATDPSPPLQLASESTGSGDPVVITHGFTGSAVAMAPLLDQLHGWRRIAVDLPGHGSSPAPRDPAHYSVEAMARSVTEVAAAVPDRPCHFIGYSMGGRVALALAVARPELCRSLTLISATAGIGDDAERATRRESDAALADRIDQHGLEQFIEEWLAAPMWDTLRERLNTDEWQASIRQRMKCSPVGLANSLRAGGTGSMTPLWNHLTDVEVPTLLVCGQLDAKFVEVCRQMHDRLPHSDLAIVESAGHAVHFEQPDTCAAAIAQHLAAVDRPGPPRRF